MIFVGMGKEDALNLVSIVPKLLDVEDDDVNAILLLVGETEAAVYDDNIVVLADNCAVFANFTCTAKRNHLNQTHEGSGYLRTEITGQPESPE